MNPTILIIGGGLCGLTAAVELQKRNLDFKLIEASDRVGGRVHTKYIDGFQIDRGFQVFFDSYQTPKKYIALEALNLHRFDAGAWVGPQKIGNPLKHPELLFSTLSAADFSFCDKLIIGKLILKALFQRKPEPSDAQAEITTLAYLQQLGLSDRCINAFFRPFFGGVFLDPSLSTSSKFFNFTFRNFVIGNACLPLKGMQAIGEALRAQIPAEKILLNTSVQEITENSITLANGETLAADTIVIATDARNATRLLRRSIPLVEKFHSTTTMHFRAPHPPYQEKMIYLNPHPTGAILHLCPISNVCSHYAPVGQSLISVTINPQALLPSTNLQDAVYQELETLFGTETAHWELLDTDTVTDALPAQPPGSLTPWHRTRALSSSIMLGGDHTETSSIEGAMLAGEQIAQIILANNFLQ
jgi:phytoene dehydrogenase-like protein